MDRCARASVGVAALLLLAASPVQAGMPSPVLTETGVVHFGGLAFFLIVLLVLALLLRWVWNALAADFPALPRLSYGKALAAVLLIGLLLGVVLTMIAGARELLTPGAWQRDGRLYKVAPQQEAAP